MNEKRKLTENSDIRFVYPYVLVLLLISCAVEETISIAEANPQKFNFSAEEVNAAKKTTLLFLKRIQQSVGCTQIVAFLFVVVQLASRKKFISQTKATIGEIKQAMVGTVAQNKQESDQRSVWPNARCRQGHWLLWLR